MKVTSKKYLALVVVMLLLPILAACGAETPTATPIVAAPTNTTAPVVQPTDTAVMEKPTATTAAPEATATTAMTETTSQTASATDTLYSAVDCSYGGLMKSIEAVNDTTVKFTLCAPDPAFPSKIAFSSLGIQSAAHLKATGGKPLEEAVGTGPYMVKSWTRGDSLTLVANPNYWGTAPKTPNVIMKWNDQSTGRLNSLNAGEADAIDNPDTNDFASIESNSALKLIPREALNVFYLGMNNTKAPLDNEAVRQAIAMGINRQTIVDKFYPKGSSVASHFTPCAIPGGCEGEEWYEFNLDQAKQMLSDANVGTINLKLAYRDVVRGYLPSPGKVAEEIQAQLAALGVNVTIDVQESGTFLDNASAGNLEMFLLGWGADYPDATNFLDSHFGTGANDSFGTKWDDITSKLQAAASLSDPDARNALYAEANNAIKTHVPMIPVAHGGSATVWGANVEGAQSSPLGNESFKNVAVPGKDTFIWIQNAEPISLYCGDETDGESLRACEQIFDPLLAYKEGSTEVELNLAENYEANTDLTEWTITLRSGVKFSDNTPLTAKDVVATYGAQWDVSNPLHTGRSGTFDYWTYMFTAFLNAPPSE